MKLSVGLGLALAVASAGVGQAREHHHHLVHADGAAYGGGGEGYYTNAYGHAVHRPTTSARAPDGATARCGDGSWSFSESRRGTCSHHGGVGRWL